MKSCLHFRGQIEIQNKLGDQEKPFDHKKKENQSNKTKNFLLFKKNSQLQACWKNKNCLCDTSSEKRL